MRQTYHKWDGVLQLFFENSEKEFTIREISKQIKIPRASVQRYLKQLQEEGLLTKENKTIVNPYFKFKKTFFLIDKIFTSGLLDY